MNPTDRSDTAEVANVVGPIVCSWGGLATDNEMVELFESHGACGFTRTDAGLIHLT